MSIRQSALGQDTRCSECRVVSRRVDIDDVPKVYSPYGGENPVSPNDGSRTGLTVSEQQRCHTSLLPNGVG